MDFSWIFLGILEFCGEFEEKLTRKIHATFLFCVFVSIYTKAEKIEKEKNTKRLSFITQFMIEFLLPLTSWKKVLGKMPGSISKMVNK